MRYQAASLAIAVSALSCLGAEARPGFTIRVENGVTIVENAGLHVADSAGWTIDTVPAVRIGVVDGPQEYMIGQLAGALRRPDGTIVVADAMAHELRVFDSTGRFVRKVGRQGQGPGEYDWMTNLLPYPGDSIIVMDHENSRSTVLDPELRYVRRFRPRLLETRARYPMTSHRLIGFLDSGRPVLSDYLNACGPRWENGFCEDSVAFYVTDDTGATVGRVGRFVYGRSEFILLRPGESTGWWEPHPQAIWTVGRGRFYYADAKRFEIRVFRTDGTLERVIRVAGGAPRYSRDEVFPQRTARVTATNGRGMSDDARRASEAMANARMPDTFPAFSDLLVDADDNVWVREYMPASRFGTERPRWFVFDSVGVLRWSLRSPPHLIRTFRPWSRGAPQIGDDHVLTSMRDEDGVESVVLLRLTKQPP